MPINKIVSTKRGKAAIAAAFVAAAVSGWQAFTATNGETPQSVRAAIAKGITPPEVDLAVERLIKPWEGLQLRSHRDPFAKIYDICFGETLINGKPVTANMSFTADECKAMLIKRVINDYYLPLVDRGKGFLKAPYSVRASMISGAYNFGVAGQLGSTAMRYVASGEYRKACEAQTAWNKAGGKVVNGLVRRREMGDAQRLGEAELCVSGL